MDKSVR